MAPRRSHRQMHVGFGVKSPRAPAIRTRMSHPRPRIAVVNSSSFGKVFPEHWKALEEFADLTRIQVPISIAPDDFIDRLKGFQGILASVNPDYPEHVLRALKDLVVITRHGIGYNNVDVKTATALGIPVTKVSGPVERISVAEQTMALLFSIARKIPQADAAVRRGAWAERASFIGVEVTRKKVGVIGAGNIGSMVIEMLSHGFACDVMANDPHRSEYELRSWGAREASIDEIVTTSDIIALQCSLTPSSYHILDEAKFARMKRGVLIVNSARGELVDDKALVQALESGQVGGYAGDVVEGEPIGADHPILKAPNCIIVPHLGGYSYESLHGMGATMVEDMREVFVHGRVPVKHLVDPAVAAKGLRPWA
jgi:phosphoglycerate dehydrogenase-like enzyme